MKIKVEDCWNGRYHFWEITLPCGGREEVRDKKGWQTEALDLLENVYGLARRNIRFDIK